MVADISRSGSIQEIARLRTPDNFTDFCNALAEHCPQNNQSISIAVAGVIHPASGRVTSANIPCLSERLLSDELEQSLNRSVYIVNDANAFVLAESHFGQARDHETVLGVILGTGVGGGIVVRGKLLCGADGTTGEWGHSPASAIRTGCKLPLVDCNCGQRGCIDTLGGARGLERLYEFLTNEKLDSQTIIHHWQAEHSSAAEAVDCWLDVVGGALAGIVNFIGPSTVAVGGGLANSMELIDALDIEVRKRSLARRQTALLYSAVSGPEVGLLGALINSQLYES